MKFLTNTYGKSLEKPWTIPYVWGHETPAQAVQNYENWLRDKVIGDPMPTEKYSVQALKEMGMVGVYAPDEDAPC